MIKVLIILTDTNIGGAGKSVLQLLSKMDRTRFAVTVAVPHGAALIPYIRDTGCGMIETRHSRDRSCDGGGVIEYVRIIREIRPDIVHTHSSLSGRIAAYACGVRSRIITKHCVYKMAKFPVSTINGLLSTHAVAVCDAVAESLAASGFPKNKITVIPNGTSPVPRSSRDECISFRKAQGIGEDDFVGLVSARLEKCKDHGTLVEMARILRSNNVKLVFMGDGSERENLERQCRTAGVSHMIRFTGFAEDTAPWYNIANAVLNSSVSEALSLSILEGMSLGKPSVVTCTGGNSEAVTDGVNGFVVPVGDPEAFARGIMRLMNDGALYKRLSLGAAARYRDRFDADIMCGRIMRLYEDSVK